MLTVSGICNSDADSCEHILTEQKEPRQSTKWQSSVLMLSGDEARLRYRVRVWRTVDKPAVCLARLTLASGGSCSWVWKTVHFSHCGLITLPTMRLLKVVWSMDNESFFFHPMAFHDSFSGHLSGVYYCAVYPVTR